MDSASPARCSAGIGLGQLADEPLVEQLLARERALLRGQRLVLERLQFRRDVALRVAQGLPAAVVVRDLVDVRVRDLDVEAVDLVELDLERRDRRALALAPLEVGEERAAVAVERAQLVQLGVVAVGDDAAVAQLRGRLGADRRRRSPPASGHRRRARRARSPAQRRIDRARAVPRSAAAPRASRRARRVRAVAPTASAMRAATRSTSASPRSALPSPRRSAASATSASTRSCRAEAIDGSRDGSTSQSRSRRLPAAVAHPSSVDSSVGAGAPASVRAISRLRRVEASSPSCVPGRSTASVVDVRERRQLRRGRVVEQRARRARGDRRVLRAEGGEVARADLLRERARAGLGVEVPRRPRAHRHAGAGAPAPRRRPRAREFGHVQPIERRGEFGRGHVDQSDAAGREVEPGDAGALARDRAGGEQAARARVEQARVGHRARRHDPRHLALDRALRRRRVAELLDDHHRLAQAHQSREVLLDRVVRHARHRDRRAGGLAARGERDVEQARGALGVVVEELVEVAHPVEHELVRMLGLDAEVLLHHRRVRGRVHGAPMRERPPSRHAAARAGPRACRPGAASGVVIARL